MTAWSSSGGTVGAHKPQRRNQRAVVQLLTHQQARRHNHAQPVSRGLNRQRQIIEMFAQPKLPRTPLIFAHSAQPAGGYRRAKAAATPDPARCENAPRTVGAQRANVIIADERGIYVVVRRLFITEDQHIGVFAAQLSNLALRLKLHFNIGIALVKAADARNQPLG